MDEIKYKKPLLTAQQLIDHMKLKGITFDHINEVDAVEYLENNNNYFRLSSYRKNYRLKKSNNILTYVSLDFEYLKDLAIIDLELRSTIVMMCLDIEHYTKLEILRLVESEKEDGYLIVDDYIRSLSNKQYDVLTYELERSKTSKYCSDLYNHYNLHLPSINDFKSSDIPVWVFIEVISFGSLISFYKFCADRYNCKQMLDKHYLLKSCKSIRNAAAHNNCILNDLSPNNTHIKTSAIINNKLSKITAISRNTRQKKMSNIRIQEIVTLFISYNIFVTSIGMKNKTHKRLILLSERMFKHIDYYQSNNLILSTFTFLKTIIDEWIQI